MNAPSRRDFVLGSTALGPVLAARESFAAAAERTPVDCLYPLA